MVNWERDVHESKTSSPISVSELESTTSIKPEQFFKAKSPNSFAIISIFRKKICFNNIFLF